MAPSVLHGTKLTPDSSYLDVVFLLSFLPELRAEDKPKRPAKSSGTKTLVFFTYVRLTPEADSVPEIGRGPAEDISRRAPPGRIWSLARNSGVHRQLSAMT
jgi:hypothetical protein